MNRRNFLSLATIALTPLSSFATPKGRWVDTRDGTWRGDSRETVEAAYEFRCRIFVDDVFQPYSLKYASETAGEAMVLAVDEKGLAPYERGVGFIPEIIRGKVRIEIIPRG